MPTTRLSPPPQAPPVPPSAAPQPVPSPPLPAAQPVVKPQKPKPTWKARLRGGTFGLISLALCLVIVAGVTLRLTVKDGFAPLAPAFYALSVPVLVTLGLLATLSAAIAFGFRLTIKRGLLMVALGVLGGLNAAIFLFQDATFDDRPRVVLWNVAGGAAGWDGVAGALETNNPTLAVLVESGGDDAADAFWRDRFGDQFFVERPGGGLTILSRGMIGRTESVELPGGARAATAKLKIGGERANLLVVDLPSNPLSNRAESLRTIAELAEEMSQRRPTILAGDFNTPPESVHFNDLRRAGFVHAFERHGSGYAATWPSVAPALHLDHVWLSPGFDAGETWHGWTVRSDHRPVFSPVRVAPARFEAYQTAAAAAAQDIDAE